MTCDLTLGPVHIQGSQVLECNGESRSFAHDSRLVIVGQSTSGSVRIEGATLAIEVSDLSITAPAPFVVSQSSLTLVSSHSNRLLATSATSPAIECSGHSNISLSSIAWGSLVADGGASAAGLGAGKSAICESISVLGGSYSFSGGTGLGAYSGGSVVSIRVQDASVNATGTSGAGIGGGDGTVIGSIALSGKIFARGAGGAGIGAGPGVTATSTVRALSITGGEVTAVSVGGGAGIGAGYSSSGGSSIVDSLVVSDGRVTASAGEGAAGIGSGLAKAGFSNVTTLTISGGTVTASAGEGAAGIGSGLAKAGSSSVTTLTISGGTVTARGIRAAGIGSGRGDTGHSFVRTLSVSGGTVQASATFGAGIGSGTTGSTGLSTVTGLSVSAPSVDARSTDGPGIGAGSAESGNSSVGSVGFWGGVIRAVGSGTGGGVGFGAGPSFLGHIDFGGRVTIAGAAGAGHHLIEGRSSSGSTRTSLALTVFSPRAPAWAMDLVAVPQNAMGPMTMDEMTIIYGEVTTAIVEPFTIYAREAVQWGTVALPPGRWNLTIAGPSQRKTIEVEGADVKSLMILGSGPGEYRLTASNGVEAAALVGSNGAAGFNLSGYKGFFPVAKFNKVANTVPVIVRTSGPSLGIFPPTGPIPRNAPSVEFTLTDPDPDQSWTLFWRFDSEVWRPASTKVAPGPCAFKVDSGLWVNSRVNIGSHTIALYVADNLEAASNVITVSYNIAANAKSVRGSQQNA